MKSRSREIGSLCYRIVLKFLTDASAAVTLPRYLSNFRAIGQNHTAWLRGLTRYYDKMSFRIIKWVPGRVMGREPWTRLGDSVAFHSERGLRSSAWKYRYQLFKATIRHPTGFVSLSMPFNQHSGAIHLRSKSYLVVKISSDIVSELCCQVWVLSMFCRSDFRLCADMVSDGKRDFTPQGQRGKWYENILYIWFSDFTLTETHRC